MNVDRKTLASIVENDGRYVSFTDNANTAENDVIASGNLLFDTFPSGVGVHSCNIVELKDTKNSSSLSPCVSINVLLAGMVCFCLGENRYTIDASASPVLFINVIPKTEIFTRYFTKQQTVTKTNVTLDKQWIIARCQSTQDENIINALFSAGSRVYQLPCDESLINEANKLAVLKRKSGMNFNLQAEQVTFSMINKCLPLLLESYAEAQLPPNVHNHSLPTNHNNQNAQLQRALDSLLKESLSLEDIAKRLGTSVSTLQRKVKSLHQVSAKEYIRHRRLAQAKNDLLLDGLSIGEIAYHAGYRHVANFVTAFKKRYQITPAELRKLHTR